MDAVLLQEVIVADVIKASDSIDPMQHLLLHATKVTSVSFVTDQHLAP